MAWDWGKILSFWSGLAHMKFFHNLPAASIYHLHATLSQLQGEAADVT